MTRSIEFITDNNRFQLALIETNGKLSTAILSYHKEKESADEDDWIFGELLDNLRTESINFLSDYMRDQMNVNDLNKEDVTQLIEILDEGKKWLNKPVSAFTELFTDKKGWLAMIEEGKEQFDKAIEENIQRDKARRYNSGKRQWSLLHYPSIEEAIKVLEFGAFKYSIFKEIETGQTVSGKELIDQHGLSIISSKAIENYELVSSGRDNWKNGLNITEMKESAQRHLVSIMNGEEKDKESGCFHSAHLIVNSMFMNYYELKRHE